MFEKEGATLTRAWDAEALGLFREQNQLGWVACEELRLASVSQAAELGQALGSY